MINYVHNHQGKLKQSVEIKFEFNTIDDYEFWRKSNFELIMDFLLFENFNHVKIPEKVLESEKYYYLIKEVIYYCALSNDIISLEKELNDGENKNWLIVRFLSSGEIYFENSKAKFNFLLFQISLSPNALRIVLRN